MFSKPNLRERIFLIGVIDSQIYGNKLPNNREVMKVLFHNLRVVNLSLRKIASLVIKKVKLFWEEAGLPTQQPCRCIEKLEKLYIEWRNIQRNVGSASNAKKEETFSAKLLTLFDIAHRDVLETVDDTRRQFLLEQRRTEQVSCTRGIESVNFQKRKITELRMAKNQAEKQILGEFLVYE